MKNKKCFYSGLNLFWPQRLVFDDKAAETHSEDSDAPVVSNAGEEDTKTPEFAAAAVIGKAGDKMTAAEALKAKLDFGILDGLQTKKEKAFFALAGQVKVMSDTDTSRTLLGRLHEKKIVQTTMSMIQNAENEEDFLRAFQFFQTQTEKFGAIMAEENSSEESAHPEDEDPLAAAAGSADTFVGPPATPGTRSAAGAGASRAAGGAAERQETAAAKKETHEKLLKDLGIDGEKLTGLKELLVTFLTLPPEAAKLKVGGKQWELAVHGLQTEINAKIDVLAAPKPEKLGTDRIFGKLTLAALQQTRTAFTQVRSIAADKIFKTALEPVPPAQAAAIPAATATEVPPEPEVRIVEMNTLNQIAAPPRNPLSAPPRVPTEFPTPVEDVEDAKIGQIAVINTDTHGKIKGYEEFADGKPVKITSQPKNGVVNIESPSGKLYSVLVEDLDTADADDSKTFAMAVHAIENQRYEIAVKEIDEQIKAHNVKFTAQSPSSTSGTKIEKGQRGLMAINTDGSKDVLLAGATQPLHFNAEAVLPVQDEKFANTQYPVATLSSGTEILAAGGDKVKVRKSVKTLGTDEAVAVLGITPAKMWLKVRTSDGKEGYVKRGSVKDNLIAYRDNANNRTAEAAIAAAKKQRAGTPLPAVAEDAATPDGTRTI